MIGGVTGGILGGTQGGIHAAKNDLNFWNGTTTLKVTSAGATGAPKSYIMKGKYVGKYEGVNVFETSKLGRGQYSGGLTIPEKGIFVGKHAFSRNLAPDLLRHEFGHILQYRMVGAASFYTVIGRESLISAALHNVAGHNHNSYWTETWANYLSSKYFGNPANWNIYKISNRKY